jgi:hypothetical protein
MLDKFVRGQQGATAIDLQEIDIFSNSPNVCGNNTFIIIFGCTYHRRARTVTKNNTGPAVFPVRITRERLGSNHQDIFIITGLNEIISHFQSVYPARTGCCQVKGRHVPGTSQFLLNNAGLGGQGEIACKGGINDKIEIVGPNAAIVERLLGGPYTVIAFSLALGQHTPLFNAGARFDPFV